MYSFLKGQCSNFMTNISICHSDEVCKEMDISVTLTYVNTINNLADPISHGFLPPASKAFPLLSFCSLFMPLSDHLSSFLEGVDIPVQATTFYINPPLNACHAASLPPHGHICLPSMCKDGHIVPSLHCPNVLARKQVLHWTTPHSDIFQSSLDSQLPPSAILKLFKVILFSLDESTCSNYGTGLLHFTQYCDSHSIPEHSQMLASEILLSSFAASTAVSVSKSALNNWASLQYWHVVNGAAWHGSNMLHHVCCGFSKLVPPAPSKQSIPQSPLWP